MMWMDTTIKQSDAFGKQLKPRALYAQQSSTKEKKMHMKILLIFLVLQLFINCSKPISVTQQLEPDEVKTLISQDTLYEDVILEVENTRKSISDNIVLMSKFTDLSYPQYLEYKKSTLDTTFLRNIQGFTDSLHGLEVDMKLSMYKTKIDSEFYALRKKYDSENPDNFFRVNFEGTDVEYYEYNSGVKSVTTLFKITPLKGKLDGGAFHYDISPKVTGKVVASGGCRWSQETVKSTTYSWEAPYKVEKELGAQSDERIQNAYDFTFRNTSVRYYGKPYTALDLFDIPIEMRMYFKNDSLKRYQYRYIMQNYYNVEIEDWVNIFQAELTREKKKLNTLAYEFESQSPDSIFNKTIKKLYELSGI